MTLYRIESPHSTCGILVTKGTVVSAGDCPELLGQPITSVKAYCKKKGWTIVPVDLEEEVGA